MAKQLESFLTKQLRVLVLCETSCTHGRDIIEGINQFALENNWLLFFEQRGRSDSSIKRYQPWNIDGIISRTYYRSIHKTLMESRIPFIELIGGITSEIKQAVGIDGKSLAITAANHFIERGLRHFAYYCMEESPIFSSRRDHFFEYIAQQGYECEIYPSPKPTPSDYVFPIWHEKYRPRLRRWLEKLPKPVGLFTAMDNHAQVILNICQESGIRIPQEVAIVGVGNDEWVCRLQNPPLSSIDGSGYTIGYTAARLLMNKMNGRPVPTETIYIPCSFLAIRQSSDFYSVGDSDIEEALAFIRKNACQRISIQDILDHLNISRRTLFRGFRKWLNRTPQMEILRVQLETAQKLLRETNLSLVAIANRTGFSSSVYLVRMFRRQYGVTPHVYRNEMRFQSDYKDNTIGRENDSSQ